MAEWSSFFNSYTGDRRYTAAEFVEYFANFIGNGVFWGGDALKVNESTGMDVQVETGKCFINGYYYINKDTPKTLTIEPSDSVLPRIDRVVERLDLNQSVRKIQVVVKTGIPSDNPVAPQLQRDEEAWELGLADIRVIPGAGCILQSNISDLRLDKQFCGVVAALINQPDLTNIFNQYQSKFNEVETHWDGWFADTKEEWADLKSLYIGWISQIKAELFAQINTDFDDWSDKAGYKLKTKFMSNGDVTEEWINSNNNSILVTRLTEFLDDDKTKMTLKYYEPELTISKVSSFSEGEDGDEVNEEVF